MTTPWLRRAYRVNQEINDRIISYPLRYEKNLNMWKFQFHERNSKSFRIHFSIYLYQGISTILSGVALLYSIVYLRDVLKTFQVLAGSLFFLTAFNGFVIDVIIVVYGTEIAACINALFGLGSTWPKPTRDLSSKRHREYNGVLALYIVVGVTIVGFCIPVLIVFSNLDPIYTLVVVAKNIEFFRVLKIIDVSSCLFIVVRYTLNTISMLVILASLRTVILLNLGTYSVIVTCFRILNLMKLEKLSLHYYLQLCVLFNAMKQIFKIFTFSMLSSVFFVIVLAANGTILLASLRKHLLAFMCGVDTVCTVMCVIFLFNISDQIYSDSRKLLLKWEKEALSRKYNSRSITKSVISFWPMVIPLGTVGAMDKQTKNAYLEQVLNYIFNLLVMVN